MRGLHFIRFILEAGSSPAFVKISNPITYVSDAGLCTTVSREQRDTLSRLSVTQRAADFPPLEQDSYSLTRTTFVKNVEYYYRTYNYI
jgi:hypothetical protein